MVSSPLSHGKEQLRAFWQAQGRQVAPAVRAAASRRVGERLRDLPEWRAAGALAAYWPLPDEVAVNGLVEAWVAAGRELWLPRFDAAAGAYVMAVVRDLGGQLRVGRFGVREPLAELPPADPRRRDALWLVPGVAFDRLGTRLGRGQGYYDRLLAGAAGCAVGVTLDATLSAIPLPRDEHDIPMRLVVTETETVRPAPL